ncbi:Aspartate kinase [Lentibacillus sp. JNUCC-1]|uniref:aspartate kinase n=1 Tax=Lentibacillus sp. JNUCC-1 TaxID=2654513 RepID=UPI0012E92018|nr:aspartate kinase [Lentibacillus sp. JNUCC-1]MUV37789.1 Aspartate kinase [Lentibacillus sp. JNUCC-1]
MDILVQKFGGTSVQTAESREHVTGHIKEAVGAGYKVAVVVSAMGRSPDPYATDTLLGLVDDLGQNSSDRELDLLVSCGETISAVKMANELGKRDVSATALTGAQAGFITDDHFTEATIKRIETKRLMHEFKTHDVVVVAGFQGRTEQGDITTLGRGGSDTSAAALGAALKAERIEIFTDVSGIMTADPRVVDDARLLDVVTYKEICDLAYQGAKVVHPYAVEIAMQDKIPMRVRSNYSSETGTLITETKETETESRTAQLMTGIAHMSEVTQIQIVINDEINHHQTLVFEAMADAGISVDFINVSQSKLIYTIPHKLMDKAVQILDSLGYEPEITQNCAKVCAVGPEITGVPDVSSKINGALTNSDVQVLQSAESHTTIWVLVHDKDLKVTMNALHQTLGLAEA